MNDIYLSNVKTFESLGESTLQLGFNGYVMKEFGVENPWIQIGSVLLSMLSIFRSMAARYAFVQYNIDPGFSINLAKSFAILFFPTFTLFLVQIITWTDRLMISEYGALQMVYFHPIFLGCFAFYGKCISFIISSLLRSSSPLLRDICHFLHVVFLTSLVLSVVTTTQDVSFATH